MEISSLIFHYDACQERLKVPNSGQDVLQYLDAMAQHLRWLALAGTQFCNHACDECLLIHAVVTDGITIGHSWCSASPLQLQNEARQKNKVAPKGPCVEYLTQVHDQYCQHHQEELSKQCKAQPCIAHSLPGKEHCENLDHIRAYQMHQHRKHANFTLACSTNRPGTKLPSDSSVHQNSWTAALDDLDTIFLQNEADQEHEMVRDGGAAASKKKSQICLSHCQTHNDQLIVGTCGIIIAQITFYHSESVSAVKQFILDTFPGKLLDVIFYDNACQLVNHIWKEKENDEAFMNTVIPVDAFHSCSHSEQDAFCKQFTQPGNFPELKKDGHWVFNSSAAELTNIWYCKFAFICRGMHAVRYNYFLEEMVRLRNIWLEKKLMARKNVGFVTQGWFN
ncbi:hypothetical protein CROQUDRAFT_68896 [Cronartium quercuum f. sp. fusiforme G11]|uniref:CxC6 like cysteine cluster associated with KDZ domain-containing protein n=1 Tax=Cronartium quercuum f. sp. fusiforme G11 TaxID=708437 RepID=A0A9P6N8D8_9BASI|nr:hypothetical protein CROQUDRAFT_68896 [Cronartium quercuum f. sp. fusiforme G11]